MTKTEQKLLDRLADSHRETTYFHGLRERSAAHKLRSKGLVEIRDLSAYVPSQLRHGRWVQGSYHAEGTISRPS